MCAPSPPPPPDYAAAATAQGAANKEAAIAASRLNNPNVVSPLGTQTFTEGATPEERPTVTQAFSPAQQQLFDQQLAVKQRLGALGIQGADSLSGIVGRPLDLTGAPPAPGTGTDTRNRVYDAMMARVNEDYGNKRDTRNSDLIAAGIRPGTKAYDDAMQLIERGRNDAMTQAFLGAGQEASRDFQMGQEARRSAIGEILAQRQTPLNEVTALTSGSQVSNPFTVPGVAQNSQIAPAPIFAATQAQYGANADAYNAQAAGQGNMLSGLFGLGGAALGSPWLGAALSDRRLKRNIKRLGVHPLGIGWYSYDIADRHEQGVMADEVLMVKPEAAMLGADGYWRVDYGAL